MDLIAELSAATSADPSERTGLLDSLWNRLDAGDHAARCIAAHYIADAQPDLSDEVSWDETALRESINVSDADLQAIHPSFSVAGFMPSLHLNLADGYRRQGRFDKARDHLQTSAEFDFALDAQEQQASGYSSGIRTAREEVAAKLSAEDRG